MENGVTPQTQPRALFYFRLYLSPPIQTLYTHSLQMQFNSTPYSSNIFHTVGKIRFWELEDITSNLKPFCMIRMALRQQYGAPKSPTEFEKTSRIQGGVPFKYWVHYAYFMKQPITAACSHNQRVRNNPTGLTAARRLDSNETLLITQRNGRQATYENR